MAILRPITTEYCRSAEAEENVAKSRDRSIARSLEHLQVSRISDYMRSSQHIYDINLDHCPQPTPLILPRHNCDMSLDSTRQSLLDLKDTIMGIPESQDDEDMREIMTDIDQALHDMYHHVHALVAPTVGESNKTRLTLQTAHCIVESKSSSRAQGSSFLIP